MAKEKTENNELVEEEVTAKSVTKSSRKVGENPFTVLYEEDGKEVSALQVAEGAVLKVVERTGVSTVFVPNATVADGKLV